MSEYEKHFGLQHAVFKNKNGADFFFASDQLKQVVGLFQQALQTPNPSLVVSGPAGCGKSVAVACALTLLPGEFVIAKVGRSALEPDEVIDQLLRELGIENAPGGVLNKLGIFKSRVCQLRVEGKRLVIIVEDGAETGKNILAEVDVLCSSEADIALVTCGDEDLPDLFDDESLAQAKIRLSGVAPMGPLAVDELESFVQAAVTQAGGDYGKTFSKDFAGLLHILSCGILRDAHNMVEASLAASAAAGESKVSCATLADVARDQFGVTTEIPVHRASAAPAAAPEPEAVDTASQDDDFDIPDLIQDTQPEMKALDPSSVDEPEEDRTPTLAEIAAELDDDHEQLPDLKELTAEFAAVSQMLEALEIDDSPADEPADATPEQPVVEEPVAEEPVVEAPVVQEPVAAEPSLAEPATQEPSVEIPVITESVEEVEEASSSAETDTDIAETIEPPPATETVTDIADTIEPPPATETVTDIAETVQPTAASEPAVDAPEQPAEVAENKPADAAPEDVPAWDRDPTLAELRPDLDALNLALAEDVDEEAVAAEEEQQQEVAEPEEEPEPAPMPEITLDDSIQEKVERESAELSAGSNGDSEGAEASDEDGSGPSDTEVHRMMQDLSKANSLEDMDDKLAETLFGDEINMVASQVLKVAREKFEAEEAEEPVELSLEQTSETKTLSAESEESSETAEDLRKQFEDTWGEIPGEAETIDLNGNQQPKAGLDSSASQRLATLRALNANMGKPGGTPPAADKDAARKPAKTSQEEAKPKSTLVPIEDQIDISITATFKALKIDPEELKQHEESEPEKKGFFSRFRKKG